MILYIRVCVHIRLPLQSARTHTFAHTHTLLAHINTHIFISMIGKKDRERERVEEGETLNQTYKRTFECYGRISNLPNKKQSMSGMNTLSIEFVHTLLV